MTGLAAWLTGLSARERTLLAAAAALAVLLVAGRATLAVRRDLASLRARVATREGELARVRRAAAVLRRSEPPAAGGSLLARLEAAADATLGRERIADMTPAGDAGEERASLGVRGASLAETVHLLHALESGSPPVHVLRLELRKHPDDDAAFDATLEVTARAP